MTPLPYQSLELCFTTLVAARGSQIDTFNMIDGGIYLSSWKCPSPSKEGSDSTEISKQNLPVEKPDVGETVNESSPVAKRRKLTHEENVEKKDIKGEETESKNGDKKGEEAKSKPGKGKRKTSKPPQGNDSPNVILLASTADGQHVVAVTGEDKTIRVFKLSIAGVLEQLSQRYVRSS